MAQGQQHSVECAVYSVVNSEEGKLSEKLSFLFDSNQKEWEGRERENMGGIVCQ